MLNRQSRLQNLYTSKDENLPDEEEYKKRLLLLYLRNSVNKLIEKGISESSRLRKHSNIKFDRWTRIYAATHIIKENYRDNEAELLDSYGNTKDSQALLNSLSQSVINEIIQQIHAASLGKLEAEYHYQDLCIKIKQNDRDQKINATEGTMNEDIHTIIEFYRGTYSIIINKMGDLSQKHRKHPITYHLRDEKILEIMHQNQSKSKIQVFAPSKVRFIQHDLLDHANTFYILKDLIREAHGPTSVRHEDFFKSIGHPFRKTIMGREGELIAAISFACRQYYWCKEFNQDSLCSMNLLSLANKYNLSLEDSDNDILSHVICNCILEAEELQAKLGMSYSFNSERQVSGRFDPWSREYIEFISVVVNTLHHRVYSASRAPLGLALIAEDYVHKFHEDLIRDLQLSLSCYSLHVDYQDFEEIPSEVREYIRRSCHFSAAPPKGPSIYCP